jgi:flagellar hook protein FlgE
MSQSFYSSLSGLTAFEKQISVISNNISNVETTAYKTESVTFAEMLSSAMAGNSAVSTGNGVTVVDISASWTQGDLTETGNTYDLAVTGSGFFVVTADTGVTYYTRDGSFEIDEDGNLVSDSGMVLQGYAINDDGSIGALGDIVISSDFIEATPTSELTASLNLDSGSDTGNTFSSTITTYDSLGNEIPVTITFTKSASNEWGWTASIDSTYGTASGSGTLTFDTTGALVAGTDPTITLTLTNGATATQTITWDLYDGSGNTNGDITQYAATSSLSNTSQDGNAAGSLSSVSVDENGVIVGSYSNGTTKDLFRIALATFTNPDGLTKTASSTYSATTSSGVAVVGAAGADGYGTLTSGSLETSNVDLAEEMSELIIAQRSYEACAKVISTESDILRTIINVKS